MQKKSLIIGINNYQHFAPLENCNNDAEDIHTFLSNIGFESTLVLDSTQAELIKSILEFKDSISENTISLIYFSGHGLQDEKYNYLVTSDSNVKDPREIKYNCIAADDLLIKHSKKNLHLIILDACRNNPFYTGSKDISMGLYKMDAPAGTLIAFSTSPNYTSIERKGERNGIYTKFLLRNMNTPNLPAELVFKNTRNDVMKDTSDRQVPWEESSLFGDNFSFIKIEEKTIEELAVEFLRNDKNILLPELMPFINKSTFESAPIEQIFLILTLLKISFDNEQEGITQRTVDENYFNDNLFDTYYPIFQERLINEDTSNEFFTNETFQKLTIIKNINFGYNFLDTPEESFPQMMINFVKFEDKNGILSFYLSSNEEEHLLKPTIITIEESQIKFYGFTITLGDKVTEIMNTFFEIRKPFEKDFKNLKNNMTIGKIDEEEFKRLFK